MSLVLSPHVLPFGSKITFIEHVDVGLIQNWVQNGSLQTKNCIKSCLENMQMRESRQIKRRNFPQKNDICLRQNILKTFFL